MPKTTNEEQWPQANIIETNDDEPNPNLRPISKKEPWELNDGIKWNQTRIIIAKDSTGEPLMKIRIEPCRGVDIEEATSGNIYRVLTRYFEDGSVREILIDFSEPHLDWQSADSEDDGTPTIG